MTLRRNRAVEAVLEFSRSAVKAILAERKVSINALAREAGIDRDRLYEWLGEKSVRGDVKLSDLARIAEGLGVELRELIRPGMVGDAPESRGARGKKKRGVR